MSEIKHYIYPPTIVKHYSDLVGSKEDFNVIECKICKFKYIIPIPTQQELDKSYNRRKVI